MVGSWVRRAIGAATVILLAGCGLGLMWLVTTIPQITGTSGPFDGLGPETKINRVVSVGTVSPIPVEIQSIRCGGGFCVVMQWVTNPRLDSADIQLEETLTDSRGQAHPCCPGDPLAGKGDLGVRYVYVPHAVGRYPMLVTWDNFEAESVPVSLSVNGVVVTLPQIALSPASPPAEAELGPAISVGASVATTTAFGSYQIYVDSIRCGPGVCQLTQRVDHQPSQEGVDNGYGYPVWQQQAIDSAGNPATSPIPWTEAPTAWSRKDATGFMVHPDFVVFASPSDKSGTEFTVTYNFPPDRRLTRLLIPGYPHPVSLPQTGT